MPKLKVIFDTDPGIDDAMALLLLARHPDVELLGVTTVFGNSSIADVTRNALYLKDLMGFDAPVCQGAAMGIGASAPPPAVPHVHGENGLGDVEIPAQIAATLDPRPAPEFIIEMLRAHPGEITLIAVGRMTNLALALQQAPEIVDLVKEVVVMGGAFGRNGHFGNVSPVAEANIHGDPLGADIAFAAKWPVVIVGLDVTQEVTMTNAFVDEIARTGPDGAFIRAISAHYARFYAARDKIDGFYVHDASAVTYALHPEFFATERGGVCVVPDGIAKGQTFIKPEGKGYAPGPWDNRPSQTICIGVQAGRVLDLYRGIF